MDRSFRSNLLNLFEQIIEWRNEDYTMADEVGFHWSGLHLEVVSDYFSIFSKTCDFRPKMISLEIANSFTQQISLEIANSFTQQLQNFFMVPMLKNSHESNNSIKKYQQVEAFISFLLKILCVEPHSIIGPCEDRINNLKKELRFLVTVLGDTSLMLCDEHEEFQTLLAEFEAVANEAGTLVHSLFFSIDGAFREMDEGLSVVLNHIVHLNANIKKFLKLLSSMSRSAYIAPKTSAVDSLLIVDSLIHELEDLMNRKDNPIADVRDQIKMLHQELDLLRSSIKDIGSPKPSEIRELKEPLLQIGDMAQKAEYLISSFLVGDAPPWYLIHRLTDVYHNIKLVGTKLQEITKKYKFGDLKAAKYFSAQLSLQAKRNTEVDVFTVGFDDRATHILNLLEGGTERLQVISILGMPGLGKTTLAKKLYNDPLVNRRFDKLSWCVVSQTYQKQSILTNIFNHIYSEPDKDEILEMKEVSLDSQIDKDRIQKMKEESLVEHIYKTLKGRRYLIVMDDIWHSYLWYNFQRCFPDDRNGSRILFTTRNKDVALTPPNRIIYEQPTLSDDQCWELLEKKVFDSKPCPPELLGIGKKIAANCRGLPLTVVVIAGMLSTTDKEKSTWEEVGENLASYILDGGDNSVMRILELSYKHLPDRLKPCFLYFGAFEEDKEISVGKLTRLWISEGFVRKEQERSAENVAEEYLMELIDKSLAMVAKRRLDGGVKACVIHDLLHELCLKLSEEENFLKIVKIGDPRFLSFRLDSIDYSIYDNGHRLRAPEYSINSSYNCQQVRSYHGSGLASPFYVGDMRLLRVLHFDYLSSYLIGVEFLVYLRYLVIYNDLPPSIDRLVNLEYLRVEVDEGDPYKPYLSPAILKMRKLRYIHADYEAIYDEDCDSSQENNLEVLSGIDISKVKDVEMLRCSPHLRKLKCQIESDQDFDLRFLTQLESLSIDLYGLSEISFPSNIKKLTLCGTGYSLDLPIIGRLEHLEVLKVKGLDPVEGESWHTRDGEFQKLRYLELNYIDNLTQWNVDSREHFPMLQQLVVSYCFNLQEIPSEIGEIATLQLIEVKGQCPKSLVESAKRIQQEQRDMGNEELRVVINTSDTT